MDEILSALAGYPAPVRSDGQYFPPIDHAVGIYSARFQRAREEEVILAAFAEVGRVVGARARRFARQPFGGAGGRHLAEALALEHDLLELAAVFAPREVSALKGAGARPLRALYGSTRDAARLVAAVADALAGAGA